MSEIAHGIDVYHKNDKDFKNVVFLPDDRIAYYPPGGMLFELISDSAYELVIEKPKAMIHIYPGYQNSLTPQSVTDGFRWLYGTVLDEDESLPVATELFRCSFNEAIQRLIQESDSLEMFPCVGAFLEECHAINVHSYTAFSVFFDALAAIDSKVADEEQKVLAEDFQGFAGEMMDVYTRHCSVRRHKESRTISALNIAGYIELLVFEFCQMKKKNKVVKICANCGRYFIPPYRNDSIYCQAPAPDDPSRSCKQVGSNRKQARRVREDPNEKMHHRVKSQIGMMKKRAEDRGEAHLIANRYRKDLDDEKRRYEAAKEETGLQGGIEHG